MDVRRVGDTASNILSWRGPLTCGLVVGWESEIVGMLIEDCWWESLRGGLGKRA